MADVDFVRSLIVGILSGIYLNGSVIILYLLLSLTPERAEGEHGSGIHGVIFGFL
jgi:phage shock protein PspC (stress-responsive transcriptional regulator)